MPPEHSWPADPASAWADATNTLARGRPRPPDLRDFEVFAATVSIPGGHFLVAFMMMVVAANISVYAFAGFYGLFDPWWFRAGATVAAVGLATWAIVYAIREHRARPHLRRAIYEDTRLSGIVALLHGTGLRVPSRDGEGDDHLTFLIDAAIPDEQAARLHAAVAQWTDRLAGLGRNSRFAVRDALGGRRIVPMSEVFGPEAHGGYLTIDFFRGVREWRILIPHDRLVHTEKEGTDWNVYSVKHLEPPVDTAS